MSMQPTDQIHIKGEKNTKSTTADRKDKIDTNYLQIR